MSKKYSVLTELKLKANEFKDGMDDAVQKTNTFAKGFTDRTKAIGEGMQKLGSSMTKKVTLPIVAGATGAVAAFKGFDDSMRNTQALLGDSLGGTIQEQEENLGILTDKAKEMGIQTAHSASDAADAMGFMALAGWDTTQIMAGIEPALNLASAAGMDLAIASDIMTDSMSMFAMEAHEAERMADVLAETSSSTNTNVEQLGEALVMAGANAHASGMDIETTSSMLGLLADNGLKGSKAGTTLNAMLRDLKDASEDGAVAIGDTNVALYDSNGEMRDMTDVVDDVIKATDGMSDSQRDAALSGVFNQQSIAGVNILLNEGVGATKNLRDELYDSEGAASKMAEILEGGLGGSLRSLKSALEGLAISFGETLAPMIAKGADKVTEITRKFADLDEGTKKTIITMAGIAAAIGPVLLIGGKLFVGVSSLITAFTTVSSAIASAGGAMALLTNPIGWVIAGIGGVVAISVAWYKNFDKLEDKIGTTATVILGLLNPLTAVSTVIKLFKRGQEDAIEEVDRFGDKVSSNTKKVLGKYFELADGVQMTLDEMFWGQDEITKKSADNLIEKYDEMNNQIIKGLKERHQEEIKETKFQFTQLDGLSEERQGEILQDLDNLHTKEIEAQEKRNERIREILDSASNEKRELTKSEHAEITALNDLMNENAVTALSKNEAESAVILERMKAQSTEITAQQAAEVVRNSKKATDGAIEEAEKQYDETIAWIVQQRDETGTISAEEADELIKQAERQRDGSIKSAEERHENIIRVAQEQAEEHVNKVDWETGEILSKWEVFKNNLGDKMDEIKEKSLDTFESVLTIIAEKMGASEEEASRAANIIREQMVEAWKIVTGQTDISYAEMFAMISDYMQRAKGKVAEKLGEIKGDFADLILKIPGVDIETVTKAKETISGIVDDIKGFFSNMKLKIPEITVPKMPTIPKPSIPAGLRWNAKGTIFNKPTIFDTPQGLQGVGEKGSEVVMPLYGKEMKPFADAITSGLMTNFNKLSKKTEYNPKKDNDEKFQNRDTYNINLRVDRMNGTKDDANMVLNKIVDGIQRRGGKI